MNSSHSREFGWELAPVSFKDQVSSTAEESIVAVLVSGLLYDDDNNDNDGKGLVK